MWDMSLHPRGLRETGEKVGNFVFVPFLRIRWQTIFTFCVHHSLMIELLSAAIISVGNIFLLQHPAAALVGSHFAIYHCVNTVCISCANLGVNEDRVWILQCRL